jgi:Skp family chaperone for outer membrane proteins
MSFIKLDESFHRIPKEKSNSQANISNKKKMFDTSQQSLSQVNSYDVKL